MQYKPARRRTGVKRPSRFGDQVTCDHAYAGAHGYEGLDFNANLFVVYDLATDWLSAFPVPSKEADPACAALRRFAGTTKLKSVYSDNSPEIRKAVRDMGATTTVHVTSVPGLPATNAIAENMVKRTLVGTRNALLHAGLPSCFWPYACQHYAFCRNTRLYNGDSSWNMRHKKGHLNPRKLYPFGCGVMFKPSPVANTNEHKLAPTSIPGVFLGFKSPRRWHLGTRVPRGTSGRFRRHIVTPHSFG